MLAEEKLLCFTDILYSSSSFFKGNLRGYWMDSIHTFTHYPAWV